MKTRETRRYKAQAGKQVKAKLPQYKAGKRTVRTREKSTLKCSADVVETGSTLLRKSAAKRKKRKERTNQPAAEKYAMAIFSESNLDSEETGETSKREKNKPDDLGSPVIVEALSNNLSNLFIPKQFKDCGRDTTDEEKEDETKQTDTLDDVDKEENRGGDEEEEKKERKESPENRRAKKKNLKQRKNKAMADRNALLKQKSVSDASSVDDPWVDSTEITLEKEEEVEERSCEMDVLASPGKQNRIQHDSNQLRFYTIRNKVVVIMEENSRFCFAGKLLVRVLYGAAQIYGHTVTPVNSPVEVYSPRGYSCVAIENKSRISTEHATDVWVALAAEGITRETENKLVADANEIRPGMTVLLLSNFENKLTRFLKVFYPFKLFPKMKSSMYLSWTDPKRAEVILQSNLYFANSNCKDLVIDTKVALEVSRRMLDRWRANEWSCTLFAGGKNVGKSTSTRYLINNLLPVCKSVVLLDLDPGQSECTPPGCISYTLIDEPLMGPNFTHLKRPVCQHYIGDVNVARCITRYVAAVKMLVERLTSCPVLSKLPIVVNTMGFTEMLGWDVIMFTIKLIRPSLVVQIKSRMAKHNYKGYLGKAVVNQQSLPWCLWGNVDDPGRLCEHELFVVQSKAERKGGNDAWNMEPYQQRELVTISYLSEIVGSFDSSLPYYSPSTLSINDAVPFVAPFSSLCVSIPHAYVPASDVLSVVNGNIVALCGLDLTADDNGNESCMRGSLRVLTRPPLCDCYGFGIVRGVDMEREQIFINSPLPFSVMRQVNCLVGCIPVPDTLLQLNQQRNAPYAGGNEAVPTSRQPRRGYFRMRSRSNV